MTTASAGRRPAFAAKAQIALLEPLLLIARISGPTLIRSPHHLHHDRDGGHSPGHRALPVRPRPRAPRSNLQNRTPPRTNVAGVAGVRSEEHTSELQSLMRISYAVFCLKKKTQETL